MNKITKIYVCWNLYQAGISAEEIPRRIGVHRATVYRWIRRMKISGIQAYLREYKAAKRVRHRSKTDGYVKALVYKVREEKRDCCGEKIQYYLKKEYGIQLARSTIYRILNEKYRLRRRWKNKKRGTVLKGEKAREVVQVDTVDLGDLYAYTAIDTFTREVDVVIGLDLTSNSGARALKRHLNRFGTIEKIQRDGGKEFMRDWNRVASKSVKEVRTARPYRKNEQAYIERFNGILRKECVGYRSYRKKDKAELETMISEYLEYYHNERPHLSLNMLTPNQFAMSHLQ